jgi:hypothetical protein
MPHDDWRKARDRTTERAAKREFASEGQSSYPYVWGDDPLPRPVAPPDPPAASPPAGPARAVWCVHDHTGRAVMTFDYHDRSRADDAAVRLTEQTRVTHYVAPGRVPITPTSRGLGAVLTPGPGLPLSAGSAGPSYAPGVVGVGPTRGDPWHHRVWRFIRRLF